jgi:glutamyl-tRNA synthetase
MDELCKFFSMERLNRSPAVFDYKKLEWFNGQYIRKLDDTELKNRLKPFLERDKVLCCSNLSKDDEALLDKIIPLIKERLHLLSDASNLCRFFFELPRNYTPAEAIPKKMDMVATIEALQAARALLLGFASRSDEQNEAMFRAKAESMSLKINQILQPLRVAITGSSISPPLFPSMMLLGEEECLKRCDNLLKVLKQVG